MSAEARRVHVLTSDGVVSRSGGRDERKLEPEEACSAMCAAAETRASLSGRSLLYRFEARPAAEGFRSPDCLLLLLSTLGALRFWVTLMMPAAGVELLFCTYLRPLVLRVS